MSGRLGSFSLPNLSLFIVKVLAGEYQDFRDKNNGNRIDTFYYQT
jgi:hypothetical protein